MKKILFFIFLSACSMAVQAQPLINNSDIPVGKEHLLLLNRATYPDAPAGKGSTAKITAAAE